MKKKILHYDMDAFYASVEIEKNSDFKDKPLVVGGGVITTASYEARKLGIHSGMNTAEAKKICPEIIVVTPDHNTYSTVSKNIKNLVRSITTKSEFIALDEGYLDITDIVKDFGSPLLFAEIFKERLFRKINLTCSVGIGYNKLSAKIASDINKPNGAYIFNNNQEFLNYIWNKPIRFLPGVGKSLEQRLHNNKIHFIKELYYLTSFELRKFCGDSYGQRLYDFVRGDDFREVKPQIHPHSIGKETTFRYPISEDEEIIKILTNLMERCLYLLLSRQKTCKTVTIKVRSLDGKSHTRSKSLQNYTNEAHLLKEVLENLIEETNFPLKIKLLGVSLGNVNYKRVSQLKIDSFKLIN